MEKNLIKSIETASVEIIHEMCIESLPPDLFEKWEEVKAALLATRKAFKEKPPVETSGLQSGGR